MASSGEKMRLYHARGFMSSRCLWLIEEMGISEDVELVPYNPFDVSDQQKQEYQSTRHPHGLLPALALPDGHVMWESVAINLYLAERYQKLVPPPEGRPEYYTWSVYACTTLDRCLKMFVLYQSYSNVADGRPTDEVIQMARQTWHEFAKRFQSTIAGKEFICGDSITTADINVGYILIWFYNTEPTLFSDYPDVQAYLDRMRMRPAFQAAVLRDDEDLAKLMADSNYKPRNRIA